MASSHRRPPPARRRSPDTSPSLSGSSMPRGNGSDSGQDMDDNGDADEVIDHSAPAASSTVDMVPHERVEALERLNDDLTRQLADMEHMFQRKLTEQEAEFKDLQFKLEETRSELSAAKREEKELRSKDRQKSTQIGALEADVGKFSKQLETSKAAYTGLQRQYLDQCTSAEKYRNDLRERDETVHSLREAARLSQIQHQKSTEIGALENEDLEDEDSEDEDDVVETRSVRLSKRLDPSKMSPSEVSYSFSERREYSDACTSTESLVLNAEDRQPPKSSPVARNSVVELVTRVDRLATIACHTVTKEQDRVVQALQLELESITVDFNLARSQGTLDQFFNSMDTTSSLANHNAVLTQMIADLTAVTVNDVLSSLHEVEERLKSLDPSARMILTFNAETIEIGAISGGVGGAGGSGDIGGIGGLGEGPILNIAPDVRWKSVSGGIGGDGGTGIELGGNGGMGKAPLITIARKPPHVSINPADSINAHQSDEFDITSLKLDEYTGDVTVTKSTGVFQSEPSSEYQASPADLPAPLVYALQLPSFLGAFVKGWSSRTILQNTTFVGRGWTGWWLPIGVGVSVFVVVGERLRFGRGIWIFSRRDP